MKPHTLVALTLVMVTATVASAVILLSVTHGYNMGKASCQRHAPAKPSPVQPREERVVWL